MKKNLTSMPGAFLFCLLLFSNQCILAQRQMEKLNRGVVAVRTNASQVYVGWRMFATDPDNVAFNVYRGATKINATPITNSTNIIDNTTGNYSYSVKPVVNNVEQAASESANIWGAIYTSFPVRQLAGDWSKYEINDISVGDLDGDGQMDLVVHRSPTALSNSFASAETSIIEAYKMDGTFMWSVDLGVNINYPVEVSFLVYDFDGDGKAELCVRTSEGTVDGLGTKIGDVDGDGITNYRPTTPGYIIRGPEFLSVFSGVDGRELARTNYIARGNVLQWGDDWGHRATKFLLAAAYIDGVRPSIVMCRGYYARTKLEAWNFRSGTLSRVWAFDSENWPGYAGQGNHNLSIADVDNDGKDEILYGAMAVDDNGAGLFTTGKGHGDAMHVSDFNPARPGLESFNIHEPVNDAGVELHDARTGQIFWKKPTTSGSQGPGRGLMLDMDPRYAGAECFAAGGTVGGVFDVNGNKISDNAPFPCFAIWWDADPLRELLNGTKLDKWDWQYGGGVGTTTRLLSIYNYGNAREINGTKATPNFSGDILGDWREEMIYRSADNQRINIFTTTALTIYRFYTFLQDPQYRLALVWQNNTYNQPPHTSFFVGNGMATPPRPNIAYVSAQTCTPATITPYLQVNNGTWTSTASATLAAGGTVKAGPQPTSGGSWKWTGPNNFTATTREITLPNIQPVQSGFYTATYTNASGCTSTYEFAITVTATAARTVEKFNSLSPAEGYASLSVYPNPTESNVTVQVPAHLLGGTAILTNRAGVAVYKGIAAQKNTVINLGNLPAGAYTLTISNKDQRETTSIIKQ